MGIEEQEGVTSPRIESRETQLAVSDFFGVDVGYWDPERIAKNGTVRHTANFGDRLSPLIVGSMLSRLGVWKNTKAATRRRMIGVGSIMHFAREGDIVWGTGINGKMLDRIGPESLDIRAVRGPWTAAMLAARGHYVPAIFGDPGLLLSHILPRPSAPSGLQNRKLVIPNLNDVALDFYQREALQALGLTLIDPTSPLTTIIPAIANAELVIGSSLHAIIVADSYGVPARLISSPSEPEFKYRDYLLGTGRGTTLLAESPEDALQLGPHGIAVYDKAALASAFPLDLWSPANLEREQDVPPSVKPPTTVVEQALRRRIMPNADEASSINFYCTVVRDALDRQDGTGPTVKDLSAIRSLVVFDTSFADMPGPVAAVTAALDRFGDGIASLLISSGMKARATVARETPVGDQFLISVKVLLSRLIDGQTSLSLELYKEGHLHYSRDLPLYSIDRGFFHVEATVLVPFESWTDCETRLIRVQHDHATEAIPLAMFASRKGSIQP